MKVVKLTFFLSLLFASPTLAQDRGGSLDVVVEGGGLVSSNMASPLGAAPVVQVAVVARFRRSRHLAIAGGFSALPVPQWTSFGALGRIEWLPLASHEYSFMALVGTRLLIVQPLACFSQTTGCTAIGGGVLGEVGLELRSHWLGGYRIGGNVSGLVGPMAAYSGDPMLRAMYLGAVAAVAVGF